MKKFFSLIALVGVFAACQPEKLTTAFEVAPAEVTITVKVVDLLTGEDVTAAATITSETTLIGTPAIAAQDYTVSATYKEGKGSATIHINALRAGGKANYSAVIPVGGPDYNLKAELETISVTEEYLQLAGAEMHYQGAYWAENASEFILKDSATYPTFEGYDMDMDTAKILDDLFESDVILAFAELYDEIVEGTATIDYSVSAWSLYNVFATIFTEKDLLKIIAEPVGDARVVGENGVIGTVELTSKSSQAEYEEMQHPDYAGHWSPGHGHGEKTGPNAGGGLVEAE